MIWIIGNRGMLGREVCSLMEEVGTDYIGSDKEVSILEPGALEAFWKAKFGARKPLRWIINCSAYTAVDKAEEEPELCGQLNVTGPGNIAELTEKAGASLLHVSTDYVFDGAGIPDDSGNLRPYKEDDPIGPTGVYGKTKADGEVAAKTGCSRTVVIRTSWLYGQFGPNFVYTMLKLMKEKESIGVVADQYGSPTWAVDLARAIIRIVTGTNPVYGTYHFSNAGTCSWYDFAQSIHRLGREQEVLEKDCIISPVSTDQYPSELAWIDTGLDDLVRVLSDKQIESVALPPLGCGNGGLEWAEVKQLIESKLSQLPSTKVIVYEPTQKYMAPPKEQGVEELTSPGPQAPGAGRRGGGL